MYFLVKKVSAKYTSNTSLLLLGLIFVSFFTYFYVFTIPFLHAKFLDSGKHKGRKEKKNKGKEA